MYSLLIGIIAIALVAVLTGATLYYGGDAWTENSAKASALKIRNEAIQIVGAIGLLRTNEGSIDESFSISDLTPHYLKSLPEGEWSVDGANNKIIKTGLDDRECLATNEAVGLFFLMEDAASANYRQAVGSPLKGIPFCSWEGLDSETPCCITEEAPEEEP